MAYVWGTKYKSFWSVNKLLSWLLYTLRHRLQLKQYRIFVLWHLSVEKALFTAIMSRLWWFHTSKWQRWFVASNPTLVVRYKATSQPLLRSFRGAACHSWLGKLSLMNELPVIGSMCLRKDLWDRHEANIATRQKEMWGERLFRRQKKTILVRDHCFFAAVSSEMGMGGIDTREAQGFVRTTVKYIVKSSDWLSSMHKGLVKLTLRNDLEL